MKKNKEKYKLKNFDEFLLSPDEANKDLGWLMAYSSFCIRKMSVNELTYLKIELSLKKYSPKSNSITSGYSRSGSFYYVNKHKHLLIQKINTRLKIFSNFIKAHAFYEAKKQILEI